MYNCTACKVEFQPFNRSYQLIFQFFIPVKILNPPTVSIFFIETGPVGHLLGFDPACKTRPIPLLIEGSSRKLTNSSMREHGTFLTSPGEKVCQSVQKSCFAFTLPSSTAMDEVHPTSGSSPPADSTGGSAATVGSKRPREQSQEGKASEDSRQGQQKPCCRQRPQQSTTTAAAAAPAPAAVAVNTSCHPEDHPLDPDVPKRRQLLTPSSNSPPCPPLTCAAAIADAAAAAPEQPGARENAAQLLSIGVIPPQSSWKEENGGEVRCSAVAVSYTHLTLPTKA